MSVFLLITIGTCAFAWQLLSEMNPWGFFVMLPALILAFQAMWLLLNPFATIFSDRIEIRQSLIHHKERFFNDLLQMAETKQGDLAIRYTDGETEKLNLFGIRSSQKERLKQLCSKQISEAAKKREAYR